LNSQHFSINWGCERRLEGSYS